MKGVKVNELNKSAAVRTFPGATVEALLNRLNQFNIDKYETFIVHVGGNDADQGVDLDSFRDSYSTLLNKLTSDNCRLIVSGLLPRGNVTHKPYIECLKILCETHEIDLIEHYNGFLLASGDMADSYFYNDKTHANSCGTRKLLRIIDTVHRITTIEPQSQPAG